MPMGCGGYSRCDFLRSEGPRKFACGVSFFEQSRLEVINAHRRRPRWGGPAMQTALSVPLSQRGLDPVRF